MKQTMTPAALSEAWNAESLYNKGQRYSERANSAEVEDWERALWAGLTLELLARAALANVSPVLLADTTDKNWQHIYSALGFTPSESKYSPRSIAVTEVFRRLGTIFSTFTKENEAFCVTHTGMRNAELHSGDPAFNGVPLSTWQAKYYQALTILLGTMKIELKEFIGAEEASIADKLIAAANDQSAKAVKSDIEAHRKVWDGKQESDRESLRETAKNWATAQMGHRVECPSCKSNALVQGEPIGVPHQKLAGDLMEETQEFLPANFECVACDLKINGLSKLNAAGLGEPFKRTSHYELAAIYAPADDFPGYDDDNNEPMW